VVLFHLLSVVLLFYYFWNLTFFTPRLLLKTKQIRLDQIMAKKIKRKKTKKSNKEKKKPIDTTSTNFLLTISSSSFFLEKKSTSCSFRLWLSICNPVRLTLILACLFARINKIVLVPPVFTLRSIRRIYQYVLLSREFNDKFTTFFS